MATGQVAGKEISAMMARELELSAGACIDAYEEGMCAATQLLHRIARALELEPARSLTAGYADLTRDVVAAQVSSARWLLDI
jgi:hypothetical protein